ncbi:MAG: hypothetical protein CMF29_08465 [Kiritimatiellaceae bacterium]|nr:hypothetical protein [Kiritimatiellaceae bacterium]|tara:strand:+ start:68 stop:472 length:405 start_codon:yes stop_codon:yes gene_type:complete
MGRYYRGDIEGKFWFAVQSSDAPKDFSPDWEEYTENDEDGCYTDWGFSKDTLPDVEKHLGTLTERLGECKEKLDTYFKERDMYNDEELVKAVAPSLDVDQFRSTILRDYADHQLGTQIADCIRKNGECHFEGEH